MAFPVYLPAWWAATSNMNVGFSLGKASAAAGWAVFGLLGVTYPEGEGPISLSQGICLK